MEIKDMLRGLTPGRRQKVALMTVIPLLADSVDDRFGAPDKLFVSTSGYGTVVFNNPEDKEIIVPMNVGYIVSQSAQNHGMVQAGFVDKKKMVSYKNAACIQSGQSGTISSGQHQFMILPWFLRETAFAKRSSGSFSKLWPEIEALNTQMGVSRRGHLDDFFEHFKLDLEQFIAQFEIVPKQVGAIVIINGRVAGIERAPNYDYWKVVWRALIRECYGSLALQAQKGKTAFAKSGKLELDTPIESRYVKSIADLRKALKKANDDDDAKVKALVNAMLPDSLTVTTETLKKDLFLDSVTNDKFVGQVVRDGKAVVYSSLVTKEKWVKDEDWLSAKEFSM